MSFADFVRAQEDSVDVKSEAPHFGDGSFNTAESTPGATAKLERVVVRFLVANMQFIHEREQAEEIFTKSLQCENTLKSPGDVCVFADYHSFDKEGNFTVVIKYAELAAENKTESAPQDQEGNTK